MQAFVLLIEAASMIIGSLIAATLLCLLLWKILKRAGHPQWSSWIILGLVALTLFGRLSVGPFLQIMAAFAMLGTVPLWVEGRAWRARARNAFDLELAIAPPTTPSPRANWCYPAITGCISEARAPTRGEIHLVASRFWRASPMPNDFPVPEEREWKRLILRYRS